VVVATVVLGSFLACSSDNNVTNTVPPTGFVQTDLITDASPSDSALTIDPLLVNPWGLAFNPNAAVLWVSNNGSGTSTLYDTLGNKKPLAVTIPSSSGAAGNPTGVIFNATADFAIPGIGSSIFIFAGEDGTISAWHSGATAQLVADRSASNAVYKGIAMASNAGVNFLYLTNFKQDMVDVFDTNFQFVTSFTDPNMPAGYAPFGIQNINGKLYVTFAKQLAPDNHDDQAGVGNGFVDVFNTDGTLSSRFASNGRLNSPWGIAIAPAGFGTLSGDILIGNFGDGLISAYDLNGNFVDVVRDTKQAPIQIDGLWALTFGPGTQAATLWFSSGPNREANGIVGTLTVK
jgi:uncharacterized protein (TIGR03118 family)